MNSFSMSYLLQRLSGLGLETLDFLNGRGRQDFTTLCRDLCRTLLELKGEATSVAIAEEIIRDYQASGPEDKTRFFHFLHDELGTDPDTVATAITAYQQAPDQSSLQALRQACEAPRLEILRTLNTAPEGILALIAMREDLERLLKEDPVFPVLDNDFLNLFHAWFNRGFLELRRIDWRTPAFVLEKLIQYESVHEIRGWPDLRRRLEHDRRCYSFFHPAIPDMPLIFVEAALTDDMSSNVTALLQQAPPHEDNKEPNTAVFFSINNCLRGLRGVSFGSFLIKQVIEHLAVEAPHITQYVTLSPVPGFLRWLRTKPKEIDFPDGDAGQALEQLLAGKLDAVALAGQEELQTLLPQFCARYLLQAKSRDKPLDSVARFHLGNGARLERINWLADTAENGMAQSAGLMVNYLYDRKTLARNHEAYVQKNELASSNNVRKLLS